LVHVESLEQPYALDWVFFVAFVFADAGIAEVGDLRLAEAELRGNRRVNAEVAILEHYYTC